MDSGFALISGAGILGRAAVEAPRFEPATFPEGGERGLEANSGPWEREGAGVWKYVPGGFGVGVNGKLIVAQHPDTQGELLPVGKGIQVATARDCRQLSLDKRLVSGRGEVEWRQER